MQNHKIFYISNAEGPREFFEGQSRCTRRGLKGEWMRKGSERGAPRVPEVSKSCENSIKNYILWEIYRFLKSFNENLQFFKDFKAFTRIFRENLAKYLQKLRVCIYKDSWAEPPRS